MSNGFKFISSDHDEKVSRERECLEGEVRVVPGQGDSSLCKAGPCVVGHQLLCLSSIIL